MNKKNYFLKQINYKLYVVIIEGKYVILIFFILLVIIVSSTPRLNRIRTHNANGDGHWLHR
jgi:hypothetical protein